MKYILTLPRREGLTRSYWLQRIDNRNTFVFIRNGLPVLKAYVSVGGQIAGTAGFRTPIESFTARGQKARSTIATDGHSSWGSNAELENREIVKNE